MLRNAIYSMIVLFIVESISVSPLISAAKLEIGLDCTFNEDCGYAEKVCVRFDVNTGLCVEKPEAQKRLATTGYPCEQNSDCTSSFCLFGVCHLGLVPFMGDCDYSLQCATDLGCNEIDN
jgi:hypothetical protein